MTRFAIIAALGLTFLLPAAAKTSPEDMALCAGMGELAHNVMMAHQNGVPLSDALGLANSQDGLDPQLQAAVTAIVKAAYSESPMRTEENKRRQRDEYRNQVELACFTRPAAN